MQKPKAFLIVLGCSLFCGSAAAQLVSFGVKGGVSLADPAPYRDQSKWFTVGPSVEFRLPYHFAAEIDALYTRTGFTYAYNLTNPDGTSGGSVAGHQHGNQWTFPVLGKYYFGSRQKRVQPFVGTGYAFRVTWLHDSSSASILSGTNLTMQNFTSSSGSRTPTQIGATFAAGVRVRAGRVAITPELRYTRWDAVVNDTRRNEGKFLLGISF